MSELYKFDEEKHRHYIADAEGKLKMVPGVTTISGMIDDGKSGALMGWAAKMVWEKFVEEYNSNMNGTYPTINEWELSPENFPAIGSYLKKNYKGKRDSAADLGTRVHALCERFWEGGDARLEVVAEDEKPGFNAFMKWVSSQESINMVTTEMHVYSLKHRYGGILDLIAQLNNKLYLIDLKTSNRLSPGMFVQVGGYAIAYEEMTGTPIHNAGILRLDKLSGEYDWVDISDSFQQAKDDFLRCKQIYDNLKAYRKLIPAKR